MNSKIMILQPVSWKEHDAPYVVDVYGRTHEGDIARVRLTGFKPYFYLDFNKLDDLKKIRTKNGFEPKYTIEKVKKYSIMEFSVEKDVYKISFDTLWGYKLCSKLSGYESNFPPYLKLIHDLNLNPASPFEFPSKDKKTGTYDLYEVSYILVKPAKSLIPLYIMSYDLEVYSSEGFPVSSEPTSEIMQIGISTRWTDNLLEPIERFVLVVGEGKSKDCIWCSSEKDLLMKFQDLIKVEEPDILTGYNTFGFDDGYLYDRFQKYHLNIDIGREETNLVTKTFELASGKYAVRYLDMNGRLSLDLLLYARREFNLDSYKLDSVAGVFLRDKVTNIVIISDEETRLIEIHTKSTRGLFKGNFVQFDIVTNTSNPYAEGKKFFVKEVFLNKFIIELEDNSLNTFDDLSPEIKKKLEWSFCKDDITVKQIMDSHHGTIEQKSEIAKYCIQDCDLVLTLLSKLDVLSNSIGMADVCKVPLEYIFQNRGQGIRIYSAVRYEASKRNQIIPTQECAEGDISYEGAIVIPPKIGMYLDEPIAVLDYNSLYPSNMIAYNLSPDTLVYVKTYNDQGKLISRDGFPDEKITEFKLKYKIDEVSYDHQGGRQICGYIQPTSEPLTVGILPKTLEILLKKRKDTRKLMEQESDEAQKSVLNGLQLAYKVVANSIYGQTGSRTSPIRKVEVAASTTAIGRERLLFAKHIAETEFCGEVVYGDSVTSYTPVTLKINEQIEIKSIEELGYGKEWLNCTNSDKEYCELQNVYSWTEKGWTEIKRIIRHKLAPHKKIIRVLTHSGSVDVTDDHSLLKLDATEISPKDLKIGDSLLHYPLVQTQLTIDEKTLLTYSGSELTNQKKIQELCIKAGSIGYNILIKNERIYFTKGIVVNACKIKKMYEIPYEGYVYDLTTENHHFQAGIGSMIVHNTDSIFVNFKKPLQETIETAKLVGKRITELCRIAHKIDYEKTFFPFLLFCRKRYVGLMYEDDIKKCKRKFMGIALKRRDSAPIVKDIYGGALDILLEQRSLKNAESFVKDYLIKVLKGNIPLEKFIITKQLRDDYKNPAQIAHRVLADRMTERNPGNIPQVGERIAFIYVAGRSGKQGDRIENLDYVREKGLKPDSEFYITNQIQNPLAQLFALGIEHLSGYMKKTYSDYPELDEEEKTLKILSLKEKELDSIFFMGAPYLKKEKRGPLDSFFTRK